MMGRNFFGCSRSFRTFFLLTKTALETAVAQDNTGDVFLYQTLELLGVAIVVFQAGWLGLWVSFGILFGACVVFGSFLDLF